MQTAEPGEAPIAEVMAAVARTGGLDYARDRAQRLAQQAERELEELPSTPARDALRASIAYVVERRR
jgi:geranylgeranyl pyrophosphate synthase